MLDFKAKMHQIRFWLGFCPRPHWGSLQRSPRLDLSGYTSNGRGGEGKGCDGRRGKVGEGSKYQRRKGREEGIGCGARRPAGARGPALAKKGPDTNDVQILITFLFDSASDHSCWKPSMTVISML